jgi:hypothetical protein
MAIPIALFFHLMRGKAIYLVIVPALMLVALFLRRTSFYRVADGVRLFLSDIGPHGGRESPFTTPYLLLFKLQAD